MSLTIQPIYEFVLWDNCKNNCNFCWLKKHYCYSSIKDKLNAIELTKNFILSDSFLKNSHILLVGGEIFDCNDVKEQFLELSLIIIDKIKNNEVNLFYINTNLINTDIVYLFLFLRLFDEKTIKHLKFTTSYDTYGRFFSDEVKNKWIYNLDLLKYNFPSLNIVINTILTKQFCKVDLDSSIPFVKLIYDKYNYYVNLLPYVAIDNLMTPLRNDVFKVLKRTDDFIPYLSSYILNFDLPLKKLIYKYNNKKLEFKSAGYNKCGHGLNFTLYSSKGTCFICDIKELFI